MEVYQGDMPFVTNEAILAYCLLIAGCEPCSEATPCSNVYDEDILFKLGGGLKDPRGAIVKASRFAGMSLWDAAQEAWKERLKGDVKYEIKLSSRCSELIKVYREQCKEISESDVKACDLLLKIAEDFKAGAIQADEFILRSSCVNLKTRGDFMNHWKQMVPILRVPRKGKSQMVDTTATVYEKGGGTKTVPAKAVTSPGFDALGLNASEKMRKDMGL